VKKIDLEMSERGCKQTTQASESESEVLCEVKGGVKKKTNAINTRISDYKPDKVQRRRKTVKQLIRVLLFT
jgi:hypothetical protein